MRRAPTLCCALVAALAVAPPAVAAPRPARLRVVVRVASPDDLSRSTRLRGQASDLAVELQDAPTTALEPRLGDQIAAADLLTRQLGADVVIWFPGADALVYVARPAPGHVLRLPPDDPGAEPSIRYEQAALRLRRVLKTLLEGGVVGVPRDEASAARAPQPAPAVPAAPTPPGDPPARVVTSLGAAQLFDGVGSVTGLAAQVGLGLGRTEWTLAYDEYLDRALASGSPSRAIGRRSLGAGTALALFRMPAVRGMALARLGLGAIALEASEREDKSTDDTALHPYVGAGARLDFPLIRVRGVALWFSAQGSVDWLWDPPSYEPGFPHRGERSVNALQPRVGLALSLEGG